MEKSTFTRIYYTIIILSTAPSAAAAAALYVVYGNERQSITTAAHVYGYRHL